MVLVMIICPKCKKPAVRIQRYFVRRGDRVYKYLRVVHYENGRIRFCHLPKEMLTSVIYGARKGVAEVFKDVLLWYVPPPARVLDITCGYKIMYRELLKHNYGYQFVFMDVRGEVKPDVVADLRKAPFRDNVRFDAIVFDPPYPVHPSSRDSRVKEYGYGLSKHKLHEYYVELVKAVNNYANMVKYFLIVKTMDYELNGKLYPAIYEVTRMLTNFELYDIVIYRFFKRSYLRSLSGRVPRKHTYFLIYRPRI